MAFENLTDRLSRSFKNLVGQGKLTENNMQEMLNEVRFALIEADVHPQVVNDFIDQIRQEAVGQEVLLSLKPSEQVVKIVNEALIDLLGRTQSELNLDKKPSIIMMVGLQGSGKTTSTAKIAKYLKEKQGKKVLVIAADLQRLAAVDQLKILAEQVNVDFYENRNASPVQVAKEGVNKAINEQYDVVLIDTAGRLHIDQELMTQLSDIESAVSPQEILLTVDAMVGQDIVNVAKGFKEQVNLTGLVVTKYDSDSRGGGILSVRKVTGVGVKFVGIGEKMDDLDLFHPDRVASRLLGMGDILTLIEQAEAKIDQAAAEKTAKRLMDGTFTMDDLLTSLEQMSKMGSFSGLLKLMPGMNQLSSQIDDAKSDKTMKTTRAIIQSMTKEERENPKIVMSGRKRRIANGAGVSQNDVNKLLNQYSKMKDQMRLLSRFMK